LLTAFCLLERISKEVNYSKYIDRYKLRTVTQENKMAYNTLSKIQGKQISDYFDDPSSFTTPVIKGSGRESPLLYDKNAQGLAGLKLPTTKRDLDSYSGVSRSDAASGFRSDSFYDRVGAGPLYKRKLMDTP